MKKAGKVRLVTVADLTLSEKAKVMSEVTKKYEGYTHSKTGSLYGIDSPDRAEVNTIVIVPKDKHIVLSSRTHRAAIAAKYSTSSTYIDRTNDFVNFYKEEIEL